VINDALTCMWENCQRQPEIILETGKLSLALCREHFTNVVKRLAKAAETRGSITPGALKVEKLPGGKVRLTVRRKRLKRG